MAGQMVILTACGMVSTRTKLYLSMSIATSISVHCFCANIGQLGWSELCIHLVENGSVYALQHMQYMHEIPSCSGALDKVTCISMSIEKEEPQWEQPGARLA